MLQTGGCAIGAVLLAELAFLAIADGEALAQRSFVRTRVLSSATVLGATVAVVAAAAAAAELRVAHSVWLEPIGAGAVVVTAAVLASGLRPAISGRGGTP